MTRKIRPASRPLLTWRFGFLLRIMVLTIVAIPSIFSQDAVATDFSRTVPYKLTNCVEAYVSVKLYGDFPVKDASSGIMLPGAHAHGEFFLLQGETGVQPVIAIDQHFVRIPLSAGIEAQSAPQQFVQLMYDRVGRTFGRLDSHSRLTKLEPDANQQIEPVPSPGIPSLEVDCPSPLAWEAEGAERRVIVRSFLDPNPGHQVILNHHENDHPGILIQARYLSTTGTSWALTDFTDYRFKDPNMTFSDCRTLLKPHRQATGTYCKSVLKTLDGVETTHNFHMYLMTADPKKEEAFGISTVFSEDEKNRKPFKLPLSMRSAINQQLYSKVDTPDNPLDVVFLQTKEDQVLLSPKQPATSAATAPVDLLVACFMDPKRTGFGYHYFKSTAVDLVDSARQLRILRYESVRRRLFVATVKPLTGELKHAMAYVGSDGAIGERISTTSDCVVTEVDADDGHIISEHPLPLAEKVLALGRDLKTALCRDHLGLSVRHLEDGTLASILPIGAKVKRNENGEIWNPVTLLTDLEVPDVTFVAGDARVVANAGVVSAITFFEGETAWEIDIAVSGGASGSWSRYILGK